MLMKIKSIILSLGLLTLVNAPMPAMEYHNNHLIVNQTQATIAGGILGAGLGMAAHLYKNYSKTKSLWQNIKSCPWYYMVIPGVVGVLGAHCIAHHFTAEYYYLNETFDYRYSLEKDVKLNEDFLRFRTGKFDPAFFWAMHCKEFADMVPTNAHRVDYDSNSFELRFEKVTKYLDFVSKYNPDFAQEELKKLTELQHRLLNARIGLGYLGERLYSYYGDKA